MGRKRTDLAEVDLEQAIGRVGRRTMLITLGALWWVVFVLIFLAGGFLMDDFGSLCSTEPKPFSSIQWETPPEGVDPAAVTLEESEPTGPRSWLCVQREGPLAWATGHMGGALAVSAAAAWFAFGQGARRKLSPNPKPPDPEPPMPRLYR